MGVSRHGHSPVHRDKDLAVCRVRTDPGKSWKVLEFYCSEFQALESPGKRHRSWKTLENPGKSWNSKAALLNFCICGLSSR